MKFAYTRTAIHLLQALACLVLVLGGVFYISGAVSAVHQSRHPDADAEVAELIRGDNGQMMMSALGMILGSVGFMIALTAVDALIEVAQRAITGEDLLREQRDLLRRLADTQQKAFDRRNVA